MARLKVPLRVICRRFEWAGPGGSDALARVSAIEEADANIKGVTHLPIFKGPHFNTSPGSRAGPAFPPPSTVSRLLSFSGPATPRVMALCTLFPSSPLFLLFNKQPPLTMMSAIAFYFPFPRPSLLPEEKGWRNDPLHMILGRRRLSRSLVFNLAAPPGEPSPLRHAASHFISATQPVVGARLLASEAVKGASTFPTAGIVFQEGFSLI